MMELNLHNQKPLVHPAEDIEKCKCFNSNNLAYLPHNWDSYLKILNKINIKKNQFNINKISRRSSFNWKRNM